MFWVVASGFCQVCARKTVVYLSFAPNRSTAQPAFEHGPRRMPRPVHLDLIRRILDCRLVPHTRAERRRWRGWPWCECGHAIEVA